MKTILNFSHPLIPDAVRKISELLGDDVHIVDIQVHLDLDIEIKPQVDELVNVAAKNFPFAAIVPPSLAPAAAALSARLSVAQSDATPPSPPPIVVMARDSESLVTRFMPVEIMRW